MTIAALNDQFRSDPGKYQKHRVVMTASVAALYQSYRDSLMRQVRAFSDFNEENDPFNEHDFGSIDFLNTKYFWKIDYYDRKSFLTDTQYGSDDPANDDVTTRVLTVMEASEY